VGVWRSVSVLGGCLCVVVCLVVPVLSCLCVCVCVLVGGVLGGGSCEGACPVAMPMSVEQKLCIVIDVEAAREERRGRWPISAHLLALASHGFVSGSPDECARGLLRLAHGLTILRTSPFEVFSLRSAMRRWTVLVVFLHVSNIFEVDTFFDPPPSHGGVFCVSVRRPAGILDFM
jgi:hypothetical protein